jgi:hypothetical protein
MPHHWATAPLANVVTWPGKTARNLDVCGYIDTAEVRCTEAPVIDALLTCRVCGPVHTRVCEECLENLAVEADDWCSLGCIPQSVSQGRHEIIAFLNAMYVPEPND